MHQTNKNISSYQNWKISYNGKKNFQTVLDRAWTDQYEGGLMWCEEEDKTSKNACVNGPGAIFAFFLAIATGDDSYYDKADAMVQ